MRKTIKLRTEYTKGFGFYFGWQDTTIIFLVPFILLEIKFVSDKIESL
tara:strand:- start:8273 stop:8416 length:144 start_codon:yes stop_codon:yes gene_type:complete